MEGGKGTEPSPATPRAGRSLSGRRVSCLLLALGGLLVLGAPIYAAYTSLNTWLRGQDRYLLVQDTVPLPIPEFGLPGGLPVTPVPATNQNSTPTAMSGPSADQSSLAETAPVPSTISSTPLPAAEPSSYAPVQIRIPAIGVTRSIIEVAPTREPGSGAWALDVNQLFRTGRNDLVGHWAGTANPGQPGNMILVGHNYGYGYQGVFVRLGRLKVGQEVSIVDKAGQTFVYRVVRVEEVPWRRKDAEEMTRHWSFLSPNGSERLTLVSCGGANLAPFPKRVYVVAEPVR